MEVHVSKRPPKLGTWRKYDPAFQREALERMMSCSSISALARELGISRNYLYRWRDRVARGEPLGEVDPRDDRIAALEQRVTELEQLTGRQCAEIDFFRGALRRIKELRRSNAGSGDAASTTRSGA